MSQNKDLFSSAPLLCLLPEKSALKDLDQYAASFYARYERVSEQKEDRELQPEEDMLRQILDWLSLYNEFEKQSG